MLLIQYPKCTTCQKAEAWLKANRIEYGSRNIKEEPPTAQELEAWIPKSGLPVKRFFNTSGQLYRKLQLKDRLEDMTEEEMIALLATDGMLVKRPLLVGEDTVCVGFQEAQWRQAFGI